MEIGVSDERLHELFLGARAVYYGPFDEDYGYVTIEGYGGRAAGRHPARRGWAARVRDRRGHRLRGGTRPEGDRGDASTGSSPMPRSPSAWAGRATRSSARSCRPGRRSWRACSTDALAAPARAPRRQRPAVGAAHDRARRLAGPAPAGADRDRDLSPSRARRARADRLHPATCRSSRSGPCATRTSRRCPATGMRIYQLGNNADFHLPIYRMIWQAPGLVVLHDLAFDDFVRGLQTSGDRLGFVAIREALEARELVTLPDAQSESAAAHPVGGSRRPPRARDRGARRVLPSLPGTDRLSHADLRGAASAGGIRGGDRGRRADRGEASRGRRSARRPHAGGRGRRRERGQAARRAPRGGREPARRRARRGGRPDRRDLRLRAGGRGGGAGPPAPRRDRRQRRRLPGVAARGRRGRDLRYPHRGEVSGTLARAMQVGRPTIVSATGTYLDSPPETVVPVAPGPPDVAELAARIAELAADRDRRERIGATARRLMEAQAATRGDRPRLCGGDPRRRSGWSTIPSGRTMRRWADALADLGVAEGDLSDGVGLRYARALESFTHPS